MPTAKTVKQIIKDMKLRGATQIAIDVMKKEIYRYHWVERKPK